MSQIEELQKVIKSLPDPNLKKELASIIDSYTGVRVTEGLKTKFGDNCNFKVSIKNFFKPSLNRQGGAYKYIIEHVSWDNGPNAHQVFFYLKEEFGAYLNSLEFDRRIFTRRLLGLERKLISWYLPTPIANTQFNALEIMVAKVENRVNDKVTISYFRIETKDPKLDIVVKGETLEEVLTHFQEVIEDIFYSPTYDKKRQYLHSKYDQTSNISESEQIEEEDEELEKKKS